MISYLCSTATMAQYCIVSEICRVIGKTRKIYTPAQSSLWNSISFWPNHFKFGSTLAESMWMNKFV